MSARNPITVDPARRRIVALQDKARRTHGEAYMPTPEDLRQILIAACKQVGSVELWCHQLGCKPAYLRSVLAGERRAGGTMLDIVGLEWLPTLGVYADPLLDRRAREKQRQRLSRQFASQASPTRRILRKIGRENMAKAAAAQAPSAAGDGTVVALRQRVTDEPENK